MGSKDETAQFCFILTSRTVVLMSNPNDIFCSVWIWQVLCTGLGCTCRFLALNRDWTLYFMGIKAKTKPSSHFVSEEDEREGYNGVWFESRCRTWAQQSRVKGDSPMQLFYSFHFTLVSHKMTMMPAQVPDWPLLPLNDLGQLADHYCHWFLELSFSRIRLHMCGIFYFPWHRHQIEGTTGF